MSKPPERRHTADEMQYAAEIISICGPIRDYQGGMWFGHNHNFADATFVDYGACRAFAVAARMLAPHLARIAELESLIARASEALCMKPDGTWASKPRPDAIDALDEFAVIGAEIVASDPEATDCIQRRGVE